MAITCKRTPRDELYSKQTVRDFSDCLNSRAKAYHCFPCAVCVQDFRCNLILCLCRPVLLSPFYLFDIQICVTLHCFCTFMIANKLFFLTILLFLLCHFMKLVSSRSSICSFTFRFPLEIRGKKLLYEAKLEKCV